MHVYVYMCVCRNIYYIYIYVHIDIYVIHVDICIHDIIDVPNSHWLVEKNRGAWLLFFLAADWLMIDGTPVTGPSIFTKRTLLANVTFVLARCLLIIN